MVVADMPMANGAGLCVVGRALEHLPSAPMADLSLGVRCSVAQGSLLDEGDAVEYLDIAGGRVRRNIPSICYPGECAVRDTNYACPWIAEAIFDNSA